MCVLLHDRVVVWTCSFVSSPPLSLPLSLPVPPSLSLPSRLVKCRPFQTPLLSRAHVSFLLTRLATTVHEDLIFQTEEHFKSWLEDEENETYATYIKSKWNRLQGTETWGAFFRHTTTANTSYTLARSLSLAHTISLTGCFSLALALPLCLFGLSGTEEVHIARRTVYACTAHRSPPSVPRQQRKIRARESARVGNCPARLFLARARDGRVRCQILREHSHELSVKHVRLPTKIHEEARRWLTLDLPKQSIISLMQTKYPPTHRGFYITSYDLDNIKRKHDTTRLDKDDCTSFKLLALSLNEGKEEGTVRTLKLPGSADFEIKGCDEASFGRDDVVLTFQTPWQRDRLQVSLACMSTLASFHFLPPIYPPSPSPSSSSLTRTHLHTHTPTRAHSLAHSLTHSAHSPHVSLVAGTRPPLYWSGRHARDKQVRVPALFHRDTGRA